MNEENSITITGQALNAKAGAVLSANGISYYIKDLSSWPEDLYNKQLEVNGVLETIDHRNESMKDENGRWIQKMRGVQRIIKDAKWKVLQ